jgi:phage/plasmid-associated DNA primase
LRAPIGALDVCLAVRFLILSNALPGFRDAEGILADRFIYLETAESHLGKENIDLLEDLKTEADLWLSWSLRGYQSLQLRGRKAHFTTGEIHEMLLDQAKAEMAPVNTFMDRFLVRKATGVIDTDLVYLCFLDWAERIGIAGWEKNKLNAKVRKTERGIRIGQRQVPNLDDSSPEFPFFDPENTTRRRCFLGLEWQPKHEPDPSRVAEWIGNHREDAK